MEEFGPIIRLGEGSGSGLPPNGRNSDRDGTPQSSHPLHPHYTQVEPVGAPHEARAWPSRSQEPAPEGVVEVPKGAYFIYPSQPPEVASSPPMHELGSTDSVRQLDMSLLRPARGGRRPRKKAVMWEVIRSLTPEDITLLNTSLPSPKQTLSQVRHSHHQLAQLLSEGRQQSEAALLTGYSPTYVSILKDDPTFQELIAYYASQQEIVYVDVLERMKSLGLSTIDELQNRLEEDPSNFTNRELMEQAELMLVKPMVATRGGILPGAAAGQNASTGGVQVNVNFIGTSSPKPQPDDLLRRPVTSGEPPSHESSLRSASNTVIDLKAEEIK